MASDGYDLPFNTGEPVPEYGSVGAALLLLCLVSAALFYLLWTEIAAPGDGSGNSIHDGEMGITTELLRARMEQCMQRVELVSGLQDPHLSLCTGFLLQAVRICQGIDLIRLSKSKQTRAQFVLHVPSDGSDPVMSPMRLLYPSEPAAPQNASPAAARTAVDPHIHACVYLLDNVPVAPRRNKALALGDGPRQRGSKGASSGDGDAQGDEDPDHIAGSCGTLDAPTAMETRAYFVLQTTECDDQEFDNQSIRSEAVKQWGAVPAQHLGSAAWAQQLALGGLLPHHHPANTPLPIHLAPPGLPAAADGVHLEGDEGGAQPGAAAGSALSWLLLVSSQLNAALEVASDGVRAPSTAGRINAFRSLLGALALPRVVEQTCSVNYSAKDGFSAAITLAGSDIVSLQQSNSGGGGGGSGIVSKCALFPGVLCLQVRAADGALLATHFKGAIAHALENAQPEQLLSLGFTLSVPQGLPGLKASSAGHGAGASGGGEAVPVVAGGVQPGAASATKAIVHGVLPLPASAQGGEAQHEPMSDLAPLSRLDIISMRQQAELAATGTEDQCALPVAQRRAQEAALAADNPSLNGAEAVLRSSLSFREHTTQVATAAVQSSLSLLGHAGAMVRSLRSGSGAGLAADTFKQEWHMALTLVGGTLQAAVESLSSAIVGCPVDAHHTAAALRLTRAALYALPSMDLWQLVVSDCTTALGHVGSIADLEGKQASPPHDASLPQGANVVAAAFFATLPALQLRALALRCLAFVQQGQLTPALNDAKAAADLVLVPSVAKPSGNAAPGTQWFTQELQWDNPSDIAAVVTRLQECCAAVKAAPTGASASLVQLATDTWSQWCRMRPSPELLLQAVLCIQARCASSSMQALVQRARRTTLGVSAGLSLMLTWSHTESTSAGEMPARDGYWHTATAVKGKVFVYGGFSGTVPCKELLVFNAATASWVDLTRLPTHPVGPVYFHTASAVRDKVYVLGGWGSTSPSMRNAVWCLDTGTLQWSSQNMRVCGSMLDMPMLKFPSADAPAEEVQGGLAGQGGLEDHEAAETITPSAPTDRISHSATSISDRHVVVFGGMHGAAGASGESGGSVYCDTWVLDTEAQTWQQVSTWGEGPAPRFGHTALLWDPAGVVPVADDDGAPVSRPGMTRGELMAACPALQQACNSVQDDLRAQAAVDSFLQSGEAAAALRGTAAPPSAWQWRGCSLDNGVPSLPGADAPWMQPAELCGPDAAQLMRVPLGCCGTLMQWGLPPVVPSHTLGPDPPAPEGEGTQEEAATQADTGGHNTYLVPRSVCGRVPAAAARQAAMAMEVPLQGLPQDMPGLAHVPRTATEAAAAVGASKGPYLIVHGGKCNPVTVEWTAVPTLHVLDLGSWTWLPVQVQGELLEATIHFASAVVGDVMLVAGAGDPRRVYLSLSALHLPTMAWHKVRSAGAAPRQVCGHSLTVLPATDTDSSGPEWPHVWWSDSSSFGYGSLEGLLLLGGMSKGGAGGVPKAHLHTSLRKLDVGPLLRVSGTAAAAGHVSFSALGAAEAAAEAAAAEMLQAEVSASKASDASKGSKRRRRARRRAKSGGGAAAEAEQADPSRGGHASSGGADSLGPLPDSTGSEVSLPGGGGSTDGTDADAGDSERDSATGAAGDEDAARTDSGSEEEDFGDMTFEELLQREKQRDAKRLKPPAHNARTRTPGKGGGPVPGGGAAPPCSAQEPSALAAALGASPAPGSSMGGISGLGAALRSGAVAGAGGFLSSLGSAPWGGGGGLGAPGGGSMGTSTGLGSPDFLSTALGGGFSGGGGLFGFPTMGLAPPPARPAPRSLHSVGSASSLGSSLGSPHPRQSSPDNRE